MIIGITHDSDGRVVNASLFPPKSLLGFPPNGDCNHPTKLDHFISLRKKKGEEGVEWEPDLELILAAGPYSGGRSDRLVSGNFL